MPEQLKTRAIVINAIRWKESSKIVSLYSEKDGLLKLIARGAFRKNNPLAGKLETLCLLNVDYISKKSRSLQILVESELVESYRHLRLDLFRLPYALSMLELIQQTFDEGQADPLFFKFLLEMINSVALAEHPENIFIYFLLKLASYLGFKPQLQQCSAGSAEACANLVYLDLQYGSVSCAHCNPGRSSGILFNKDEYLYLKNLQSINYRRIRTLVLFHQNSKEIIRRLVKFLNYHLGANLKLESLSLLI